jgi:hypothetical protein
MITCQKLSVNKRNVRKNPVEIETARFLPAQGEPGLQTGSKSIAGSVVRRVCAEPDEVM